jgi:dTDP-4-dehydrorhamnose 3,5-epimerase
MEFKSTAIDGLLEGIPFVSEDARGASMPFRLYENQTSITKPFVDFFSSTSRKDVVRGMHAESLDRMIYVSHGEVITAIADIRPASPTFGKVVTFYWGDHSRKALYIPDGCAHGYCVLSDRADYFYFFTKQFVKDMPKRAIVWNDPDLAIPWPVKEPILSEGDKKNQTLRQAFPEKFA